MNRRIIKEELKNIYYFFQKQDDNKYRYTEVSENRTWMVIVR